MTYIFNDLFKCHPEFVLLKNNEEKTALDYVLDAIKDSIADREQQSSLIVMLQHINNYFMMTEKTTILHKFLQDRILVFYKADRFEEIASDSVDLFAFMLENFPHLIGSKNGAGETLLHLIITCYQEMHRADASSNPHELFTLRQLISRLLNLGAEIDKNLIMQFIGVIRDGGRASFLQHDVDMLKFLLDKGLKNSKIRQMDLLLLITGEKFEELKTLIETYFQSETAGSAESSNKITLATNRHRFLQHQSDHSEQKSDEEYLDHVGKLG